MYNDELVDTNTITELFIKINLASKTFCASRLKMCFLLHYSAELGKATSSFGEYVIKWGSFHICSETGGYLVSFRALGKLSG